MTVENSARYINELNEIYPKGSDLIKEGDDHLRLLKSVLKSTFPFINGEVGLSSDTLNLLNQLLTLTEGNFKIEGNLVLAENGTVDLNGSSTLNIGDPTDETGSFNVAYFKNELMKLVYPIGSLYFSTVSTNPSTLLGFGTWVPFGGGRTLIGAGSTSDINGEYKTFNLNDSGGAYSTQITTKDVFSYNNGVDAVNGGRSENMQPYVTISIWKRTV